MNMTKGVKEACGTLAASGGGGCVPGSVSARMCVHRSVSARMCVHRSVSARKGPVSRRGCWRQGRVITGPEGRRTAHV